MPASVAIPGYEFIEKLGAGSAGAVYKARQISMDRMVAIKILPPQLAASEQFVKRFYSEARAVARLNHPNIVTGIDVGEANGLYYFVMEYVDGDTLAHRLKDGEAIDEAEALEIVRQIAQALDHAYKNGIIHRDIKPANILMMQNGIAKLADLGVAKQAGGELGGTGGRVFGTPYYMSPEQASAEIDIDIRSDIYSLGATLYHLLAGKPPFHGNPPAVVMAKQIAEEPEDIRQLAPDVSKAATDLVSSMMSKKPEDRPATTADLVELVKRAQKGKVGHATKRHEPVVSGRTGRARRVGAERETASLGKKSPVPVLVAFGGLVLLVAGIAAALSGGGETPPNEIAQGKAPVVAPVPVAVPTAPVAPAESAGGQPVASADGPSDGQGGGREEKAAAAFASLKKKELALRQELGALRDLLALYEGTQAATQAAERVELLEDEIKTVDENRLIRADIAVVRAQAMELVGKKDFAGAFELFKNSDATGPRLSALEAAAQEVRSAAEREVAKAQREAVLLVAAGDVAGARHLIEAFRAAGTGELEQKLADDLKKLADVAAASAAKVEQEHRAHATTLYDALCRKVDAQLASFVPAEACRLLDEAEREEVLRPLKDYLAEDRLLVWMYEEAVAAAVRGVERLQGSNHVFKMRDGSETSGKVRSVSETAVEIESRVRGMSSGAMVVRLDISKLALEQIGALAASTMDRGDSKTFLRLAVLHASLGEIDRAREHLVAAKVLGGDTSSLERRWPALVAAAASAPAAQAGEPEAAAAVQAKPSAKLAVEFKKIEARANERFAFYTRAKQWWDIIDLYARLEMHARALEQLKTVIRSNDPGKSAARYITPEFLSASGAYELEYAMLLTYMGEMQNVPRLLQEHDRKLKQAKARGDARQALPVGLRNLLAGKLVHAQAYPAAKAKADKLAAEIAAEPDGEKLFQLAQIYDPSSNQAPLPIKWFSALFELIEKHPEHPRVTSGEALWALRRAYEYHELHEDAIRLTEAVAKLYPEFGPAKEGAHLWFLGHTYRDYGRVQEEMRDKKAVESYRKAVEMLQAMKAKYPTNPRCLPGVDDTASSVDNYIARYGNDVERVTTAMRRW